MSVHRRPRLFAYKETLVSSGSVLLLLAISGVAILGLVFLAAIWAGKESDAAALDRQRDLVNSRLQDQVDRVSQDLQLMGAGYASLLVTDPAMASDMAEHAVASSAETFGKIATEVFGYSAAFLVTPTGELVLPSDKQAARRFKWVWPLLQPMIRDLEVKQGGRLETSSATSEPSLVKLIRLEGRPSVAGVTSIDPASNSQVSQLGGRRLYLLAFRFLDGVTLDRLSREQGLAGARYARTADQEKNEVAFQIEASGTGEPIGFVIWKPDLPGSRVVGRLVPVLSVAGIVIAGLFFALMGRLRGSLRELSASEHHARHLSVHDVLTGLPNRALFSARFEQCLDAIGSSGRRAGLALVDLDRFKDVNDIYGHPAGDELLRRVADRITALIKSGDTLARVGGDEFALLFTDLGEGDDAYNHVCSAIIEDLNKPFQLREGGTVVHIGCSIGLAAFHDASQATNEIMRRADVALYEAKSNGRGRLIEYHSSLDHLVEARESLKRDLRIVLEDGARRTEVGNLELFFQGVHRADTRGELSGAEALIRWRHPTKGLLSPDKFIPIAEEAGMMDQLGDWVVRNATRAAASWPAEMSVAVNVSPSQLRHRNFDRHILSILAETGLPPQRLELELTEAALFNIDEAAQASLGSLRSHGIKIALDDFGTGFSSLSHLIQFNIDRIKIDRSFVRLLGSQAEGAAIVSAILGLSHTLGKTTTAEGVETEAQRDFLVAAGCNDLQGFLLSRPVPLTEFQLSIPQAKSAQAQRSYLLHG